MYIYIFICREREREKKTIVFILCRLIIANKATQHDWEVVDGVVDGLVDQGEKKPVNPSENCFPQLSNLTCLGSAWI